MNNISAPTPGHSFYIKLLLAALCGATLFAGVSRADNTWTGASGTSVNWNKNTNWSGTTVPANGANVHFAGTTGTSNNNNITGLTVNEILFDSGAGTFTLGGNALSVGGPSAGIVNSSTNTQTLSFGTTGITLTSGISVASNDGQIVINSKINLNGYGLLAHGGFAQTYNGQISGSGAASLASFIVGGFGQGPANVILNANNNTLTSGSSWGVALFNGKLTANNNNALGTGTFLIAVDSTASVTFGSGSNGINIGNDVDVQSDFSVDAASGTTSGTLTFSGKVTLDPVETSNPNELVNTGTYQITALNGNVTRFTGGITQSGTSPAGLTLNGGGVGGQFFFGGSTANSYTGLTTVTNGATLTLNSSATNGAIAGDLQIDAGSLVKLNNADQIADTSKVTVNGTFNLNSNNETINDLEGSGQVKLGSATFTVGQGSFSGNISGASGVLVKSGTGTLTLSSSNSYSGGTTLQSGTLLVDDNHALGTGTLLISATGASTAAFGSVNGNNTIGNNVDVQTSFGVAPASSSSGTLTLSGQVTLDVTGTTSFTITSLNSNTLKFTGGIAQTGTVPVALTLDGGGVGGQFFFAGSTANTYSGTTTVTDGATLTLSNSATNGAIAGDLQIDVNSDVVLKSADQIADSSNVTVNGTFNLNGNNETIGGLDGTSGFVHINGSTLTIAGGGGIFSGSIRDNGAPGSLVMNGTGSQLLSGSNHYTGGTLLSSGTLLADNNNAFGTGTLTINGANVTLGSGSNGAVHLVNAVDAQTSFSVAPVSMGSGTMSLYGLLTLDTLNTSGTTNFTITQTNGNVFRFFGGIAQSGSGIASLTYDGGGSSVNGIFRIGDSTAASTYGGLTTVTDYGTLILNNTGTNVAVPGNLQIDANSTVRYASNSEEIVDTATVTDNGTLNLNGNNETIATLFGSGSVQLGSGTFTVSSGSFSGGIADGVTPGALIKTGTGTLSLTGFNSISGMTNINGGQLVLDGEITGTVNVNAGTLSGTGFIANAVTNASHITPGDASGPGTLGLKVQYTQTPAGTLTLRVGGTGAGQSDLLNVEGNASLAGTLELVRLNNYQGKLGDKITLLISEGASGTFTSVINPFSTNTMVRADIVYDGSNVYLSFDQGSFYAYAQQQRLTPNETSTAHNLDLAVGDPRAGALIAFLNGEPLGNLTHDFDLIAPDELTAIFEISRSFADVQGSNIENRLAQDRNETLPGVTVGLVVGDGKTAVDKDITSTAPERRERWETFMEGSGEFVHVDGDLNAPGYDFTTGGVTIGGDYRFNDHFVAGIMGGYANTGSTLVNNGSVDVNGGKLGLFSTLYGSGFYLNTMAAGGYNSYDTHRLGLGGIAQGSTEGWEFDGLVSTGYEIHQDHFTLGPVLTAQYTHVGIDGYNEAGSLAPLNIVSQTQESLRAEAGFRLSYDWKFRGITVTPGITAGWQHEFLDSSYALDSKFANGAGNIFTVNGPALGRDSVVVSAGISVQWTERLGTYLYYYGELGRTDYQLNSVSGGMSYSF